MAQIKIREMPQDERPREKLLARGAAALTDPELIALLLRTGLPGANAVEVARQLLERGAMIDKYHPLWLWLLRELAHDLRDLMRYGLR